MVEGIFFGVIKKVFIKRSKVVIGMLNLKRFTRTVTMLAWVLGLFVFGALAETIISYSGQYAADLEQKQMLLESIKEDAYRAESGMQESVDKVNAMIKPEKMSALGVDKIDLAQIMPPTEKMTVAFVYMNNTLCPPSRSSHTPQDENIRED